MADLPNADRTSALSDDELVQRIVERDQSALLALYQRYGSQVYSLAWQVLRDAHFAEEATQDAFLKVWSKSEQWDPRKGRVSSWLLTIGRYAAIDRLRREQRHTPAAAYLDGLAEHAAAPPSIGSRQWVDGQLLRQLIQQLPEEQALVINMAFFEGLTHSQLAERLNWPLGTVKTRLRSGLQKLRVLWQESNPPSLSNPNAAPDSYTDTESV